MDKLFDKISLYDFFGYLIPGMFVSFSVYEFLNDIMAYEFHLPIINEILNVVFFFVLSYYVGVLTHEISEMLQEYFMKKIWRGLPSERFLNEKDKKYSVDFKSSLKSAINKDFGIDLSTADAKRNQEAFNLAYSKVQKLDGNDRIQLFNTLYGLYRNFFAGTAICFILYLTKGITNYETIEFKNDFTIIILCLIALLLLLRRCRRFSERFVDYVYRDYYNFYKSRGDM